MKKTMITLILVMGLTITTEGQYFANKDYQNSAYYGGGLFGRGAVSDEMYYGAGFGQQRLLNNGGLPNLPNGHDLEGDQPAPVGSGAWLVIGFGTAYLIRKRRK